MTALLVREEAPAMLEDQVRKALKYVMAAAPNIDKEWNIDLESLEKIDNQYDLQIIYNDDAGDNPSVKLKIRRTAGHMHRRRIDVSLPEDKPVKPKKRFKSNLTTRLERSSAKKRKQSKTQKKSAAKKTLAKKKPLTPEMRRAKDRERKRKERAAKKAATSKR